MTIYVVFIKLAFLHHRFDRKLLCVARYCLCSWILRPELKINPLLGYNGCTLRISLWQLLNQIANWDCFRHVGCSILSALMYSSALVKWQYSQNIAYLSSLFWSRCLRSSRTSESSTCSASTHAPISHSSVVLQAQAFPIMKNNTQESHIHKHTYVWGCWTMAIQITGQHTVYIQNHKR